MAAEIVNERGNQHEPMTIDVVREHGDTILVVKGDIDIATASFLWESLEQVLPNSERVIVDLREVEFLDSSGLSVLVRAHRRLGRAGGALVLRCPTSRVRQVLDLTGLDRLLTIES